MVSQFFIKIKQSLVLIMESDMKSLMVQIISSMDQIHISEGTNNIEKEIFSAISQCVQNMSTDSRCNEKYFTIIDSIIDRLWEKLNTGKWQDVPESYRSLYAFSSFIKTGMILTRMLNENNLNEMSKILTDAVTATDMGLLLGNSMRQELSQVATKLCRLIHLISDKANNTEVRSFPNTEGIKIQSIGKPVPTEVCPSIESFSANYFNTRMPVKLKGCIEHWPALSKWTNMNYIVEKIGPRTVPVEIGSSYTSSEWSQKLMTISSFIDSYMMKQNSEIGYLAQHQLFNQIPELLDDIREPEYCCLTDNEENGVDVNAWFGPAHTVSPMHYDPKHNLLSQVVGTKTVLLVDPQWNENVYPHDDLLLFNTAQVDPENPDFEKFPKFKDVKLIQCVLESGDMLYIPPKWWHHVRSLSASFSVSFWWD